MQIAKQVNVFGRNGRYLYKRHKAKAKRLIAESGASTDNQRPVRSIQLPELLEPLIHITSSLAVKCLGGQPIAGDSEREPGMPNTWTFKPIHPHDRDLFYGPVLQCLSLRTR